MQWTSLRLGTAIFFTMNVMVFTLILWSNDVYDQKTMQSSTAALVHSVFRYLCLIFTIPVLFLLGRYVYAGALAGLKNFSITTDLLLTLGVLAAFCYSAFSVFQEQGHVYFEVTCMVLLAVTLGRWMEAVGKQKTSDALRNLERLLPDTVSRVQGETEEIITIANVQVGDRIRVRCGQRIPVDGTIISGVALMDSQALSGESLPREVEPGTEVHAGELNLDGDLFIQVTELPSEGALQRLVAAVREAVQRQCAEERLADKIAAWFVPIVLALATATFIYHYQYTTLANAILASLSVVVISCPCALGLATPMAVWAAIGRAAECQVFVRSGEALSKLAQVTTIAFDKTGTLTKGRPIVAKLHTAGSHNEQETLQVLRSVSDCSHHPLSKAISGHLQHLPASVCCDVEHQAGRGLRAEIREPMQTEVVYGSLRFMHEHEFQIPASLQVAIDQIVEQGNPLVCLAYHNTVQAVVAFQDSVREDAFSTLDSLTAMGLHCQLLTGDHSVGIPKLAERFHDARVGLLPDEKHESIRSEMVSGDRIAMVGDGINDAAALAEASVGIAMGTGADVSRNTADICLLANQLTRIPWILQLARETTRTVRNNLIWAFAYNVLGIGLAMAGWLNPILAAIAMVGSSLLVVTNSLKLSAFPLPADTHTAHPHAGTDTPSTDPATQPTSQHTFEGAAP